MAQSRRRPATPGEPSFTDRDRDDDSRREQLYFELGERGDKVAEQTAAVARDLRAAAVDDEDVQQIRGVLDDLNRLLDEVELIDDPR